MQVAMRLGPYWWKRLGDKKIFDTEIRKCVLISFSLLGVALTMWMGLVVWIGDMEHYRSSTEAVKSIYQMIFISAVAPGLSGVVILTRIGITFAKTLIATLRFWKIFDFPPPTTKEGAEILQSAVDSYIRAKAKWLDEVYKTEQRIQEDMCSLRTSSKSCYTSEQLKNLVKTVSSQEAEIKRYRDMIPGARKGFYRALDAAQSPFLPFSFLIKESYKEYLPKNVD
jgi:hypothetical protein